MARKTAIDDLSENHKLELNQKLINSNFRDYVELELWLKSLGYDIGKSSIHRYGQKKEKEFKKMQAMIAMQLDEFEYKLIMLYRGMSEAGKKKLVSRLFFETDKETKVRK